MFLVYHITSQSIRMQLGVYLQLQRYMVNPFSGNMFWAGFLNITPDSKSDSFLPSTHFNVWLASCQRSGIFPKTNEARCLTTRGQCKITFDPYLTASASCVIAQCQLVVNCYLCLLILKNYIIIFILYLKKRDMLQDRTGDFWIHSSPCHTQVVSCLEIFLKLP